MEGSVARVLVAYGSKHGSTKEIAERIAARLRDRGLDADLHSAGGVKDVGHYSAVVLGSAVYMGRWRKDALRLLRNRRKDLAGREVWLFSSGPTKDSDPREEKWTYPSAVRKLREQIGACEHIVFGGRVPLEPSNFMERSMVKNTPPEERDARDWQQIEAWADKIADALTPR